MWGKINFQLCNFFPKELWKPAAVLSRVLWQIFRSVSFFSFISSLQTFTPRTPTSTKSNHIRSLRISNIMTKFQSVRFFQRTYKFGKNSRLDSSLKSWMLTFTCRYLSFPHSTSSIYITHLIENYHPLTLHWMKVKIIPNDPRFHFFFFLIKY